MGIKGFQSFLSRNSERVLQPVEVCNQYLMIDGSEIIYELFRHGNHYGRFLVRSEVPHPKIFGFSSKIVLCNDFILYVRKSSIRRVNTICFRGNYVEFYETVKTFFKNLRYCDIKPIVIKDGFKFEYTNDVYAERRLKKIQGLVSLSRKEDSDFSFNGYFCEYVFKQAAEEFGVPYFVARYNADEDLAAISRLLDAPVLATDTIFCAYRLPAGVLSPKNLDWKNVSQKHGKKFIKAKLYQLDNFAEIFEVHSSVLSFLGIVYENSKNYDKYQSFRELASSTMGRRFDRPYNIGTFVDWYAGLTCSNDEFVDKMLDSLPIGTDVDAERENISRRLNDFDQPRLKADLLEQLVLTVPDLHGRNLVSVDARDDVKDEDEERVPIEREDLIKKSLAGDFPYWGLQLLIYYDWGKELIHFLPLIVSDPEQFARSPQKAGAFLREWSYKILLRNTDETAILVYDRDSLDYTSEMISFDPYQDTKNLFSSDLSDKAKILNRQKFILDLLIEDDDEAESYIQQINDLSDDMKLTLAVTKSWIQTTCPSFDMQQAMLILLTLMQFKEENKQMRFKVMAVVVTIKRMVIDIKMPVDTQVLQWSSEWEVIMDEAINLNQILMCPLPQPVIGKFFSGSLLEDLFTLQCTDESKLRKMLHKIETFESRYKIVSTLLLEQEF